MSAETTPVKKTGYRGKKTKAAGKTNPGNHAVRRTILDFQFRNAPDDGVHAVGQQVKLRVPIYADGTTHGGEMEFAKALPGEFGTYRGQALGFEGGMGTQLCRVTLPCGITALLPDDGLHFEWVDT